MNFTTEFNHTFAVRRGEEWIGSARRWETIDEMNTYLGCDFIPRWINVYGFVPCIQTICVEEMGEWDESQ